ncbi:MAG TPA: M48 family metalloprotease [Geopsychrobacteraceae bacterium]|nr:M48 family metalloprotease [Geopsychrobacteraceae bacterium]
MCRERLMAGLQIGLIAVLLISAGCAAPVSQKKVRAPQLTAGEEMSVWQQVYQQIIQRNGGIYPDQELNAYVNHVGQQLISGQFVPESEYSFQVVNDSVPTTYSTPAGYVAVSRGLLLALQTEAQLAAVLSHEIGHLTMRHHMQWTNLMALPGPSVELRNALSPESDYVKLAASLPQGESGLVEQKFNDEQEKEADRIAIDLLVSAGYLPAAEVEVQMILFDRFDSKTDTGESDHAGLRHPLSPERRQAARDFGASRYSQVGGRSGYLEYAEAVEGLRQVEKGYALFDQSLQLERQGQVGKAIDSYHQALQVAPDEALILAGLGLAYLRREDPIPAFRYLTKAVNLQKNYAQSRLGLGYLYLQKGEYVQAIEHLEKSLQLSPSVEAVFLLADAQLKIEQKIKARDLYLIVTSLAPDGKLGRLAGSRLEQLTGE